MLKNNNMYQNSLALFPHLPHMSEISEGVKALYLTLFNSCSKDLGKKLSDKLTYTGGASLIVQG